MKHLTWPARPIAVVTALALAALACSVGGPSEADIEATINARLTQEAPTDAPPTSTPEPEAPAATDEPIIEPPTAEPGDPTLTATIDLRVRSGPGTHYAVLGVLRNGASARIVGKSPDGFWWKIECPPGLGSNCWASASPQFGNSENAETVAVAAVPPPPPTAAHTAVAQASRTHTPSANATHSPTPTQQTTGATATATQPGQPTATYTSTSTATTTNQQVQPTATYTYTATVAQPPQAAFDNDSQNNPARTEFLSITGTRNFSHSNDVSNPAGDTEDWVAFEFPNNSNTNQQVRLTLTCQVQGDGQLVATVIQDGSPVGPPVICGTGQQVRTVNNTKVQLVRIYFNTSSGPVYATYTLTVVGFQ